MILSRKDFLRLSIGSAFTLGMNSLFSPDKLQAEEKDEVLFSFSVVADPHCAERPNRYDSSPHPERFLRCVREMDKLSGTDKPDFMLICGDIHLWELKKHFDKISIPMHVIAGNHEHKKLKREMRKLFPDDFQINGKESDYYSFVHKGARFIGVCDSSGAGDHIGHLCSEDFIPRGQCEWLESELNKNEKLKFIFAHIPPHPEGKDENMYISRNDSRYINKLIERTQPTAMFFGHQHLPTKKHTINRTQSYTVRSCAWNSGEAPLGFLHVGVKESGIFTREIFTS